MVCGIRLNETCKPGGSVYMKPPQTTIFPFAFLHFQISISLLFFDKLAISTMKFLDCTKQALKPGHHSHPPTGATHKLTIR
jgi:hypothetical protein